MDVFPSIESTNNVLVRLVAAFNTVGDTIETHRAIAEDIRKLPISENVDDILDNATDSVIWIKALTAVFLPMAVAGVLLSAYGFICITIRDFFTKKESKDDYSKLEENKDADVSKGDGVAVQQRGGGSGRGRQARRVTIFLSLEVWLLLLLVLVAGLHTQRCEAWGANTASVQLFVGAGDRNLGQIQQEFVASMERVNLEMMEARDSLSEAAVDLAKYDEEIQDIILSKIDRVTEKGDRMAESAEILELYMQEAWVKNLTLLLSFLFFVTSISCTWVLLSVLARRFRSLVAVFTVNMLGHILMFVASVGLYVYIIVPDLSLLHPEAGLFL